MVQVIEQVRYLVSRCILGLSAPRALPAPALPARTRDAGLPAVPRVAAPFPPGPLQLDARIPAHQVAAVTEEISIRIQAILQRAAAEDAASPDRSTLVMVGMQSGTGIGALQTEQTRALLH